MQLVWPLTNALIPSLIAEGLQYNYSGNRS